MKRGVNAVVFAGCSSSKAVQINYFNGNCNTNCGGCCKVLYCVLNSSELMVVGNAT